MTDSQTPVDTDEFVLTAETLRSCDHRLYGDRAHVLSDIDDRSQLQIVLAVVCCPNCGDAVTIYKRGLPETAPPFDTTCEQCEFDLCSWYAVAVDTAYLQAVEPSTVQVTVNPAPDCIAVMEVIAEADMGINGADGHRDEKLDLLNPIPLMYRPSIK